MTAQEAYDFLLSVGHKDPTALKLGDRFVLGEWLPLAQIRDGGILQCKERGIKVLGEGASWEDALLGAGRLPEFGVWKARRDKVKP